MNTDDDQPGEIDPWADLDLGDQQGGAKDSGGAADDFVFAFDGLESETPAGQNAPADASAGFRFPAGDEDPAPTVQPLFPEEPAPESLEQHGDDVAEQPIPLTVFPPIGGDAAGSDIQIGTGRSGIIPLSDVIAGAAPGEQADADDPFVDHDPVAVDPFDDRQIAAELGLADDEQAPAAAPLGGDEDLEGAEFGAARADISGDDISFDVGAGGGSPFAESEPFAPAADAAWDIGTPESATPAVDAAAALPAVVGAAAAPAARKSGLGQMLGVVSGGVLAIPVAYSILLWGFQKDPLKIAKQLPAPVAALLPEKVRGGGAGRPGAGAEASPLDALARVAAGTSAPVDASGDAPSDNLADAASDSQSDSVSDTAADAPADAVPMAADVIPASSQPEDVAADAVATADAPAPMKQTASTASGETEEPADAATADPADAVAVTADAPAAPAMRKPAFEPALDSAPLDPVPVPVPPPAMADAVAIASLPAADALSALDAVVAPRAAVPEAGTAPAADEPAPLDLAALDGAAEYATEAFVAVSAAAEGDARDRLQVAWYRHLAKLAEELVAIETVAAESGRPLREMPASAAEVLDAIAADETAVAGLERLGRMWLRTGKRRADGVALVGTLQGSRSVGPYWSTLVLIRGGQQDGSDRSLSIVSRTPPAAEIAGETVLVTGIMFDGDAVWASDLRPVAAVAPADEAPADEAPADEAPADEAPGASGEGS